MTMDRTPRATAEFIQELERHIDDWEEHLVDGGYAHRTIHTRVERGPRLLVRFLRGEDFINGREQKSLASA